MNLRGSSSASTSESKTAKGKCRPAPRRNWREQKTQSSGHFDVSSIQRIRGVRAASNCTLQRPASLEKHYAPRSVHRRITRAHLRRLLFSGFNLYQRTLSDPRAIARRLLPLPSALHQLRPEREDAALRRLDLMNRAAALAQKMTVHVLRNAQPQLPPRPIAIPPLELRRRQAEERRDARQVALRQINEPLLLAASGAPGLALKPKHDFRKDTNSGAGAPSGESRGAGFSLRRALARVD